MDALLEEMVLHFNDCHTDLAFIRLFRFMIRDYIVENQSQQCADGLSLASWAETILPGGIQSFCTQVETMHEEAFDLVQFVAPQVLCVTIRIVLVDRNLKDAVVVDYSPTFQGSTTTSSSILDLKVRQGEPQVYLLFRPGHYDVLTPLSAKRSKPTKDELRAVLTTCLDCLEERLLADSVKWDEETKLMFGVQLSTVLEPLEEATGANSDGKKLMRRLGQWLANTAESSSGNNASKCSLCVRPNATVLDAPCGCIFHVGCLVELVQIMRVDVKCSVHEMLLSQDFLQRHVASPETQEPPKPASRFKTILNLHDCAPPQAQPAAHADVGLEAVDCPVGRPVPESSPLRGVENSRNLRSAQLEEQQIEHSVHAEQKRHHDHQQLEQEFAALQQREQQQQQEKQQQQQQQQHEHIQSPPPSLQHSQHPLQQAVSSPPSPQQHAQSLPPSPQLLQQQSPPQPQDVDERPCCLCWNESDARGQVSLLPCCGFAIHVRPCLFEFWKRQTLAQMEIRPTMGCPANDTMGCMGMVPIEFCCIPASEIEDMKKAVEEMAEATRALIVEYQNEESVAQKKGPAVFQCSICFEDHEVDGSCTLPCGHRFCFESLEQHFSVLVRERRLDQLQCPVVECQHKVDDMEVLRGCLDKPVFEKLLEFMTRDLRDPHIIDCPKCEERIWVADEDDRANLVCPQRHGFCADCNAGPHARLSCEAHRELLQQQEKEQEELTERRNAQTIAMELGWKPCPKKCQYSGGFKASEECDHVTCRCGFEFCWMCGVSRDILQEHDNRWHKPACPYHTDPAEVREGVTFRENCPACQELGRICPFPENDGYPEGFG